MRRLEVRSCNATERDGSVICEDGSAPLHAEMGVVGAATTCDRAIRSVLLFAAAKDIHPDDRKRTDRTNSEALGSGNRQLRLSNSTTRRRNPGTRTDARGSSGKTNVMSESANGGGFRSWRQALEAGKLSPGQLEVLQDMVDKGEVETILAAAVMLDWKDGIIHPAEHLYGF